MSPETSRTRAETGKETEPRPREDAPPATDRTEEAPRPDQRFRDWALI